MPVLHAVNAPHGPINPQCGLEECYPGEGRVRFRARKRRSVKFWVDSLPVDLLWEQGSVGKPLSQPGPTRLSAAQCAGVRALKLMQQRTRDQVGGAVTCCAARLRSFVQLRP